MSSRPTLVLFGASGDLARRLLLPALYRLEAAGRLPDLAIIGCALEPWDRARFVAHVGEQLERFASPLDPEALARLQARLGYRSGDLTPESMRRLSADVPGAALFYLALPPAAFATAGTSLAVAGLADERQGPRRLVVEKPFGTDLASARRLNQALRQDWQEHQILRIDHFLGKETVQNLLVFRFANRFLEPILTSQHVAQVQITAAETLGLEGRERYYDGIGALRDMLQNHLMQLFALAAMEPPPLLDAEVIREHKVEVLRAVRSPAATSLATVAVRGRYTGGHIAGASYPGYLEEPGIPADSRTETFAALRLTIDNWRWKGVPFYLRSGKRLARDLTEVVFELREPPSRLFQRTALERVEANTLAFRIRPDEAIELGALAKRPGLELTSRGVVLRAAYRRADEPEHAAYEQLLLDAIEGDRTPFLRFDEVEWAWSIVEPVLAFWQEGQPDAYPAGSEGPTSQDLVLEDGHRWRPIAAPDEA